MMTQVSRDNSHRGRDAKICPFEEDSHCAHSDFPRHQIAGYSCQSWRRFLPHRRGRRQASCPRVRAQKSAKPRRDSWKKARRREWPGGGCFGRRIRLGVKDTDWPTSKTRRRSPRITLFRLASVSKPLLPGGMSHAALGAGQARYLDAPIQKYCPAFPDKHALITTRELLGHLGGIRHYQEGKAGEAESQ